MRKRSTGWLAALAIVLLTMAGCGASSQDDADPTPEPAGEERPTQGATTSSDGLDGAPATSADGGIELAASRTCVPDSAPECVLVNDEHVTVVQSQFERAGVADAVASADEHGDEWITLMFDDDGTEVVESSSAHVADVGQDGRLVIKVGDRVLSALSVPAALDGSEVHMALPPDTRAHAVIDAIRAG